MARRMLDSSIWSNEDFAALPPLGRLLMIGMINLADDQGRLKAHPVFLRSQIFPYDVVEIEQIRVWLSQMTQSGTILLYQADGKDYVQFMNWWEYQSLSFAQPSDHPAPDGWLDRIRFNGKGNITLTYNWQKADGTQIEDTCDATGRPLPFVALLPRKNQGGRPKVRAGEQESSAAQQGNDDEKVPTFPSTFQPTFPSTFPGGKVNKDYDQDHDQEEEENNNNMRAAQAETETETDVVVVLKAFGMSENVARKLKAEYSTEHIEQKVAYLKYVLDHRPDQAKAPAGWLRRAIEENYGPPDGYIAGGLAAAEAARRGRYTDMNYLLGPAPQEPTP
jgi:hypothetical protein